MRIVSLYSHGHHASVCIVDNGVVELNFELERFTRVKEDAHLTVDFLAEIDKRNSLNADAYVIDFESVPDLIKLGFCGKNTGFFLPKDIKENKTSLKDFLSRSTTLTNGAIERDSQKPLFHVHHHFAHACSSAFTSPFSSASVVTADAGGLNLNYSTSVLQDGVLSPVRGRWLEPLGYLWEYLPLLYGIRQPGSLMAICGYGRPNKRLRSSLLFLLMYRAGEDKNWINLIYDCLGYEGKYGEQVLDPSKPGDTDLAFELQQLTNDVFTSWFIKGRETQSANLCFSGGLALNCIGNSSAFKISDREFLHIPPNPNDSGLALGGALALHYYINKNKYEPKHFFSPYLGPEYQTQDFNKALDYLQHSSDFRYQVTEDAEEKTPELVSKGFIVARYYGRSECGPRALGHRSFIARPDLPGLREIMNQIKRREWFRPFAPIILADHAEQILEDPMLYSFYMNTSATIKHSWRSRLSGVMHIDGTTRPQFIEERCCPSTYKLVQRVYQTTEIPAILNTSFNVNEPLVETPLHAAVTFNKIDLRCKYLQLNNFLIEKIADR
jgi:carbamoyltransferase